MTDLATADPVGKQSRPGVAGLPDDADISAQLIETADSFVALMRTFNRARTQMLAAAAHDVEWSAHVVLKCLQAEGAIRAGSLAEILRSDPSTVSRQVAALVKEGLLERRADPDDGRASLLALTDKGVAVLADHDRIRLRYFAAMLADWDDTDLRQFSGLLARFTDNFNDMNHEWVAAQVGVVANPSGGQD